MRKCVQILSVGLLLCTGIKAFARPIKVSLLLKERIPVSQLAAHVLDPNSDRFEDYYTPAEIRELSAPSDRDFYTLLSNLRKEGFVVSFQSNSHLVLTVRADHKLFEKVFKTHIQFVRGKFHRNSRSPQIPAHLNLISSISGLNNIHQFRPLYKKVPHLEEFADQPGILPDDIKKAYNLESVYSAGYTGKGQHIAIATYMGFSVDDVQQYYRLVGLSPVPQVDAVSYNGTAPYDADSATETELDAEFSGMIAPGAKVHVFTSPSNDGDSELTLFTAILDDNRSKVVNYSWGMCETDVDAGHRKDMDKIFERAVAQGVNILIASGDSGSDGCGNGGTVAGWPAIHPHVVAVGGTSLYPDQTGSEREVAWSGSGGGISRYYDLPSWQSGLKPPFTRRSFPDIAFNADPNTGEAIWVRSGLDAAPAWQQIGGTSMASPQWAGFLALVNQARVEKGLKQIGFINPILYKSSAKDKKSIFTDITSGDNGAYTATRGWDATTGWGSMKGLEMLDYLLAH